jgi:hypothetical protein
LQEHLPFLARSLLWRKATAEAATAEAATAEAGAAVAGVAVAGVAVVDTDTQGEPIRAATDTLVEAVPTDAASPVDETTVAAEEATTADAGLPVTTGITAAVAASDLGSAITAHPTPTARVITIPAIAAPQATMIAGDIGIPTRLAPHIRHIKLNPSQTR